MKSIFTHKEQIPNESQLKDALADTYDYWQICANHTKKRYPDAIEEWHYSGDKYGWSFRIKDKKRVLVYLLPRNHFFKIALIFGPYATDLIMASDIDEAIKKELRAAKAYAEGRGIRISVTNNTFTEDLLQLIDIKIKSNRK